MRVHFIDVGQGDSIIIEFPDSKTMIIDGGNDTVEVKNAVLQYTASLKIEKFDYLLATHSDLFPVPLVMPCLTAQATGSA